MATSFAIMAGFYRPIPRQNYDAAPSFKNVFFVFFNYFLFYLFLFPIVIYLGASLYAGTWQGVKLNLDEGTQILINCISLWFSGLFIWTACYIFQPNALLAISLTENVKTPKQWFSNLGLGSLTWFIAFPVVFIFNQILAVILESFFHPVQVDQVAVKILRSSFSQPYLLAFYLVAIVSIVPLMEEFMFRGIFQRWLSAKYGPWIGIIGASIFFSLLHYSSSQGLYNLELLPSLFLLSCYLGYLYERQRTLWAPIGLHATFNFISALMLIILKEQN